MQNRKTCYIILIFFTLSFSLFLFFATFFQSKAVFSWQYFFFSTKMCLSQWNSPVLVSPKTVFSKIRRARCFPNTIWKALGALAFDQQIGPNVAEFGWGSNCTCHDWTLLPDSCQILPCLLHGRRSQICTQNACGRPCHLAWSWPAAPLGYVRPASAAGSLALHHAAYFLEACCHVSSFRSLRPESSGCLLGWTTLLLHPQVHIPRTILVMLVVV